jgi:hypothetical protein
LKVKMFFLKLAESRKKKEIFLTLKIPRGLRLIVVENKREILFGMFFCAAFLTARYCQKI